MKKRLQPPVPSRNTRTQASANAALVQKLTPIITYKRQQLPPDTPPQKKPAMPIWPPPPSFPSQPQTPSAPPLPSSFSPYPQQSTATPYPQQNAATRSAAAAAAEAAAAAAEAGAAAARAGAMYASPSPTSSASSTGYSSTQSTAAGGGQSSYAGSVYDQGPTWPQPKWQQSLEEARARLRAEVRCVLL